MCSPVAHPSSHGPPRQLPPVSLQTQSLSVSRGLHRSPFQKPRILHSLAHYPFLSDAGDPFPFWRAKGVRGGSADLRARGAIPQ